MYLVYLILYPRPIHTYSNVHTLFFFILLFLSHQPSPLPFFRFSFIIHSFFVSFISIIHRPADLWHNFPQTMKKMNSATWMMSGDDFLENGEIVSTFSKHNLKELQVYYKYL